MPHTKRKLKGRAKSHIARVKAAHKRRIKAAGGSRTTATRRSRRLRRLAKKKALKSK